MSEIYGVCNGGILKGGIPPFNSLPCEARCSEYPFIEFQANASGITHVKNVEKNDVFLNMRERNVTALDYKKKQNAYYEQFFYFKD